MRSFTMTKTVIKNLLSGPATLMYPKEKRIFTPITRGQVENDIEKCIFCGMCSRRCPTYAIMVTKGSAKNGRSTASNAAPAISVSRSVR